MTKTTKTPRLGSPANAPPTIEELPAKIADLETRPTFGGQVSSRCLDVRSCAFEPAPVVSHRLA